jgi:hypothetical protein
VTGVSGLRAQLAQLRRSIPTAQICPNGPSRLALVLREAIATDVLPPRGTHVRMPSDYESRIATELRARIEAEKAVQS